VNASVCLDITRTLIEIASLVIQHARHALMDLLQNALPVVWLCLENQIQQVIQRFHARAFQDILGILMVIVQFVTKHVLNA
jgi:hypothetical protein